MWSEGRPKLNQSLPYDAILALSEDELEALFAHGAVHTKGRWRPAEKGEKADKSFSRLLKDRPKEEKLEYMKQGYSRSNYTDVRQWALAGEDAPVPPRGVTKGYAKEAREGEALSREARRQRELLQERESLRTLLATRHATAREMGVDIRSDVRVIERRLQAIDEKLSKEAA